MKSEFNLPAITNMTKAQDKVNWACFPLDNACIGCSVALVRSSVMGSKPVWENQNVKPHQETHAVARHNLEQNTLPSKLVSFHAVFMTVVSTVFSPLFCSCFYICNLYLLKSEVTSVFLTVKNEAYGTLNPCQETKKKKYIARKLTDLQFG